MRRTVCRLQGGDRCRHSVGGKRFSRLSKSVTAQTTRWVLLKLQQRMTIFEDMDVQRFIEIDAGKRFGRPVLIGSRIAVADVLNWLANGMSVAEILDDFPELNEEQIRACLFYAADREGRFGVAS